MSLNLTATNRRGNRVELVQINTSETFYCLGFDGKGGYELGRPLTWRETRDRYLKCIEKRVCTDPKMRSAHIRRIKYGGPFEFSYI